MAHVDLAALRLDLPGDLLPHLAGAEFGIEELLDETGLGRLLADRFVAGDEFLRGVGDGLRDRNAFDPLGAPLRRDLIARDAPDLLGVILEEGLVKLGAEAIDHEILEIALRFDLASPREAITGADLHRADRAEIAQGG